MISLLAAITIISTAGTFQNMDRSGVPQGPAVATMREQATEPEHSDHFLESLYSNRRYREWVTFWAQRIRAVNPHKLKFVLTDSVSMPPVLPRGETVRAKISRDSARGLPMIYSPDRKYFVVLHDRGNTDPSFDIVGLQDSTFTYVTFGPASFFDAAVWLSNSDLAVLGFTFYPSAIRGKGEINMMVIDYDFSRRVQRVYTGPHLSWDKYGKHMVERSFTESRQ